MSQDDCLNEYMLGLLDTRPGSLQQAQIGWNVPLVGSQEGAMGRLEAGVAGSGTRHGPGSLDPKKQDG